MSESKKKIVVKSKKVMNKFDNTRLLSARAYELSVGAKPKVDIGAGVLLGRDYIKIAQREFEEGLLDLEIYQKI